ncbi:MAG: Serine/threonine-protein kinase [Caeruleum heppii]|nr:MAG: Serine/threonine-protein kinase [Caeruleum heppii]
MATQPPTTASRRARESSQAETTVGQFRIQMEIGKGSFATVYRAIHVKNRSLVAVKSVHLQKLNKKLKENLYSEIDILKGLHHPHIVALIDCQESTAHIHLVMEFCQLGDLSYFIKKRDRLASHPATSDMMTKYPSPAGGGLNEVIVRHFLKQLASALEFLRAKNFIHRDVKPQNLLLNPSPLYLAKEQVELPYTVTEDSLVPVVGVESLPMLKIADFGFARSLPSTSLADTLCGSPLYMAPEILRYEKYDAKADLWSVGTVLYEMMVGRPPFRASNHVELLRKIERGDDKIAFPDGVPLSTGMKGLIRGLLRRNPVERIGFQEFFDNAVVKDEIPGLVGEDLPKKLVETPDEPAQRVDDLADAVSPEEHTAPRISGDTKSSSQRPAQSSRNATQTTVRRQSKSEARPDDSRPPGNTPPRPSVETRRHSGNVGTVRTNLREQDRDSSRPLRRPGVATHATAPSRQDLHSNRAALEDPHSEQARARYPSGSSTPTQQQRERGMDGRQGHEKHHRDVRERAEQEVAFERDYVLVEKRAVEVNAFADELANSPRIHGPVHNQSSAPHPGVIARRATSQGVPTSTTGAQVTPSRAMQVASGKQLPDAYHKRQSSYERRYGASPTSATSAISKALNMANFRLFGVGFSPPSFMGKGSHVPLQAYGAYPAYPTSNGGLIMAGDGASSNLPQDEDAKAVHVIEESATRSDVVYGFAEVKYKQLVPLAPSTQQGLGLRHAGLAGRTDEAESDAAVAEDDGLTVDATVTLSEEALVLYVKALSLLARSMDIAGAWWARKNRGEIINDPSNPRSDTSAAATAAAGNRINNVVQWVRSRFNEVLEKAEFVSLKLVESQKKLPSEHASHPGNHPSSASGSATTRMGTSVDAVIVSSGVTAEKLMYDRALEMSRAAAVNELVGEDLPGCEIAYVTAVRMLEAVLEDDDDSGQSSKNSMSMREPGSREGNDGGIINGLEVEDRQVVEKLVGSMRSRLSALRKKIAMASKRKSAPSPPIKHAVATPVPTIATTPPR